MHDTTVTTMVTHNRNAINESIQQINHLTMMTKLNLLYNLGEISKEELKNIIQMLVSPDKENHTVALEIINNIATRLDMGKLYNIKFK